MIGNDKDYRSLEQIEVPLYSYRKSLNEKIILAL